MAEARRARHQAEHHRRRLDRPLAEYDGLSYAGLVADWEISNPGLVDIVDLNYDEFRSARVPAREAAGSARCSESAPSSTGRSVWSRLLHRGFRRAPGRLPGSGYRARLRRSDLLSGDEGPHGPGTSLVLKNYVGISEPNLARRNYKSDAHQGDINRGVVDLFSYHPADYAVVEGFFGTEGNGPQWGDDVRHNVVIAGGDSVAVDAVGSTVMGYNPEDLECLQLAATKRLGETDVRRIDVVGRSIAEVRPTVSTGTREVGLLLLRAAGFAIGSWLRRPAIIGDQFVGVGKQ